MLALNASQMLDLAENRRQEMVRRSFLAQSGKRDAADPHGVVTAALRYMRELDLAHAPQVDALVGLFLRLGAERPAFLDRETVAITLDSRRLDGNQKLFLLLEEAGKMSAELTAS